MKGFLDVQHQISAPDLTCDCAHTPLPLKVAALYSKVINTTRSFGMPAELLVRLLAPEVPPRAMPG